MNLTEIRDLAVRVRRAVAATAVEVPRVFNDPRVDVHTLRGLCAITSEMLGRELARAGEDIWVVAGTYRHQGVRGSHSWVVWKCQTILDATATQFGKPDLYVVKKTNRAYGVGWAHRPVKKFENDLDIIHTFERHFREVAAMEVAA